MYISVSMSLFKNAIEISTDSSSKPLLFNFEYPPGANCPFAGWELCKFPCPILDVGLNLSKCSSHPLVCVRLLEGLSESSGLDGITSTECMFDHINKQNGDGTIRCS